MRGCNLLFLLDLGGIFFKKSEKSENNLGDT